MSQVQRAREKKTKFEFAFITIVSSCKTSFHDMRIFSLSIVGVEFDRERAEGEKRWKGHETLNRLQTCEISRHSPVTTNHRVSFYALIFDRKNKPTTLSMPVQWNETRCYSDSEIETRFTTNYWLNLIFTVQSTDRERRVKSKRRSEQANLFKLLALLYRVCGVVEEGKTDLFSPMLRTHWRLLALPRVWRNMKTELEIISTTSWWNLRGVLLVGLLTFTSSRLSIRIHSIPSRVCHCIWLVAGQQCDCNANMTNWITTVVASERERRKKCARKYMCSNCSV